MIALLSLVTTLFSDAPPVEPGHREELLARYREVSAAIASKDLEPLVSSGYRLFDAAGGDLRAAWESHFKTVAAYGPVDFTVTEVKEDGADLVAVVDYRVFFRFEGDPARQFEEGRSRDRWSLEGGTWRLVKRESLGAPTGGQVLSDEAASSPRLERLSEAVKTGGQAAVAEFWSERAGKGPLVEAIEKEPERLLVTFLWRDDGNTRRVEVRGGPYESSREPFRRLPGTDIWYHGDLLPRDSRFVYGLIVEKLVSLPGAAGGAAEQAVAVTYPADPLNARLFNGGPLLELPDAPRHALLERRSHVREGRVERHEIPSRALGETRRVRVYVAAAADGAPPPDALAVFLDGEDCEPLLSLPTVLDNLVAEGNLPRLVAVFVDSQGTRGRDLLFHDPFIGFLADELIPRVTEKYKTTFRADRTVIAGASLGGLTAAYAAHRRPDRFGNVLSQSGAFWRRHPGHPDTTEGWLPGEAARSTPAGVRYYLEVGRFESPTMIENNRRMRDVLRAKGLDVTYAEYNGGHDAVNWRVSLGRGLWLVLGRKGRQP